MYGTVPTYYLRYRHIRSQFGSVRYHLEFVAEGGSILTVEDKEGLGKMVDNKDVPAIWKRTKPGMTKTMMETWFSTNAETDWKSFF